MTTQNGGITHLALFKFEKHNILGFFPSLLFAVREVEGSLSRLLRVQTKKYQSRGPCEPSQHSSHYLQPPPHLDLCYSCMSPMVVKPKLIGSGLPPFLLVSLSISIASQRSLVQTILGVKLAYSRNLAIYAVQLYTLALKADYDDDDELDSVVKRPGSAGNISNYSNTSSPRKAEEDIGGKNPFSIHFILK
ncbi:hypothetical protein GQR58_018083 [Nymphon striatum]|nr:hypothetical protein GQR58_018083 [Nymphon striatum]